MPVENHAHDAPPRTGRRSGTLSHPLVAPVALGVVAVIVYLVVVAGSRRFGATDAAFAVVMLAAVVFVALPGRSLGLRRWPRLVAAWNVVLLLATCVQTARTCPHGIPDCHSHGNPLLAIAIWFGGDLVLLAAYLVLRRLQPHRSDL